ncbi:MAG: hypothetical protein ACKOW2_02285 [Sphingobacteriaceae bacterium]
MLLGVVMRQPRQLAQVYVMETQIAQALLLGVDKKGLDGQTRKHPVHIDELGVFLFILN